MVEPIQPGVDVNVTALAIAASICSGVQTPISEKEALEHAVLIRKAWDAILDRSEAK